MNSNQERLTSKCKIESISRDRLALELMSIKDKRKIAERYAASYRNNPNLGLSMNKEAIESEINLSVFHVINAWETFTKAKLEKRKKLYQSKKNRKKVIEINKILKTLNPTKEINLDKKTKLNTFGELTGYFVRASRNRVLKLYDKNRTSSREAKGGIVFLDNHDGTDENSSKSYLESLVVKDYGNTTSDEFIKKIVFFLKSEDKKNNLELMKIYPEIPITKKSIMAKTFIALINPKYRCNFEELKDDLDINSYILKKQKDQISKVLKENFKEEGMEFLHFMDKDYNKGVFSHSIIDRKDIQEKIHTDVSYITQKKKNKFYHLAKVSAYKNDTKGNRVVLKEKIIKLTSSQDFLNSKIKMDFQPTIKKEIFKLTRGLNKTVRKALI